MPGKEPTDGISLVDLEDVGDSVNAPRPRITFGRHDLVLDLGFESQTSVAAKRERFNATKVEGVDRR